MSKPRRNSSGKGSKIFISYRWEDSQGHAGRLYADLKRHFGADQIFMDVSGIEAGEDFVHVIEEKLASSAVLIAVIGKPWLKTEGETTARQHQPGDWVRLEIATALEQGIRIIPVLVGNATMPTEAELPEELKPLARRQAVKLRDDRWDLDLAHLIRVLEQGVPTKKARVAFALTVVLALALIGMLWLLYYLATVPLPVKPNADGKFNIPPAVIGTHEIVIEGPVVSTHDVIVESPDSPPPGKLLFSHEAESIEELTVKMERAQLSENTVKEFEFAANASSAVGLVEYVPAKIEQSIASQNKCGTSMDVGLKDKLPDTIHFSQARSNLEGGGNIYRELEMKSEGAELVVTLNTTANMSEESSTESQGDFTGSGCWKRLIAKHLQIDDTRAGPYTVECIVEAGSLIRSRFVPTSKDEPLWEGEDGPLSLDFGPRLQARGVSIKSFGGESIFNIRSVEGKSPLRVDSLAIKSKQLQLSVSGEEALVAANGEGQVGLRERIKRYPGRAGLLVLTTLVLALCLALLIRRLFRI